MSTPNGFLWGVASAGHQVEGNNTNSDVWLLEHVEGTIFAEPSGDACDHYHRYADDIALAAGLGLTAFRLSLEWARIEPEEGQFSMAELAHYRRVLECCHEHGLQPVVTFHHFTSPRWLLARGGWESPETPALFARFCRTAAEHLGDLIGLACTMNEPNLADLLALLGLTGEPPEARVHVPMWVGAAKALGVDATTIAPFQFTATDTAFDVKLAAHRAARDAIRAVRPGLPVGWTLANSDIQGIPGSEEHARELRSRVNGRFLEVSRGDDFVGVQTYGRHVFGPDGLQKPGPDALLNTMGEEIYPQGLESTIREAAAVAGVPVYVTENGLATDDDRQRVAYLREAVAGVERCLADGVDVRGYIVWTLLDNFEWIFGYGPKFGIVAVDRATQERTPKPSAHELAALVRARAQRG